MKSTALLPLDQAFLARLASARSLAYPLFRGSHPHSALAGPPTEFDGHRPYLPGDDTRWIDWNLFARLEELYVKVFQVEEEVEVLIMVDGSRSMTADGARKYNAAAAAAAALSYLAFLTSHPVTLVRYAERAFEGKGPFRHLDSFAEITETLLRPPQGRGTDLRRSLAPFLDQRRRPVTVILLTDGFQREPLEKVVDVYRHLADRRFLIVRLTCDTDLRPRLRGNLMARDTETGETVSFLSGRSLEGQMHRRISAYFENIEQGFLRSGIPVRRLPLEGSFHGNFFGLLLTAASQEIRAKAP